MAEEFWRSVGALERSPEQPFHEQIRRTIIDAVADGSIEPGDALPGEYEMCGIFGVSRTAVRQALGTLEHEGVVTRIKGKGTFLADTKERERLANRLTGLFEEVTERGGTVTSRVLQRSFEPADARIAAALQVETGDDVLVIDRLRVIDGEPWSLSKTWLPASIGRLLDGVDLATASLYQSLERAGVRAVRGQRTLEAILTDQREGELLGIGAGQPAIRLSSVSQSADGRPVECFVAVHRGDRSSFVFDIERSEQAAGMRLETAHPETPPH